MPRLTVKAIEALSPGPARREIPDALMQGLYLVVQPTGSKSWAVRCRQNGRPRKFTLGRYPLYGLTEAREAAAGMRSVFEGRDPARPNSGSIDDVVAQFFDRYARRHYRPKTLTECTRVLNRAVAEWRGRKLDSITRADVPGAVGRHRRASSWQSGVQVHQAVFQLGDRAGSSRGIAGGRIEEAAQR